MNTKLLAKIGYGLLLLALIVAPFAGAYPVFVMKLMCFALFAAAFNLLLGYTGIVSFAHTMFFGIGAYGVAIAAGRMGPTWSALALGIGCALLLSLLLSLAVGLFSLRVRAIFFAMITLAVAAAFQTLASQLSEWTGGEDGLTFKLPEWLSPSFEPFD
ncbi:MAG: branched-chain amino acid ABC transporter permease, partial [Comamonas sp.]